MDLRRSSSVFPWNDPESETHLNDRLSMMVSIDYGEHLGLFCKGATGARSFEQTTYHERFFLEQGHMMLSWPATGIGCRLFLRERIYRSSFRLLPLVAIDSPFTSSRGEGAVLDFTGGRFFGARYVESVMREDAAIGDYGGLPLFRDGGDTYRYLDIALNDFHRISFGLIASQIRSMMHGNVVMLASGLGLDILGLNMRMELAQSRDGGWNNARTCRLFDLDLGTFDLARISDVFGRTVAFSSELNGLAFRSPLLGSFRLVPGYRFCGEDFVNPAGDTENGLIESYLAAWWVHPELNARVSFEVRDRSSLLGDDEEIWFNGSARLRFKEGFEAKGGFVHRAGRDPVLVMSLADENEEYRISASARLDGAGAQNVFSFLAEGALNLTGSVAVRSTLYLYESDESFYSAGLEFRPTGKFLFDAGFGSFRPYDEGISLYRGYELGAPMRDRVVTVSVRVWLGNP
jgi:hypothetical protein